MIVIEHLEVPLLEAEDQAVVVGEDERGSGDEADGNTDGRKVWARARHARWPATKRARSGYYHAARAFATCIAPARVWRRTPPHGLRSAAGGG